MKQIVFKAKRSWLWRLAYTTSFNPCSNKSCRVYIMQNLVRLKCGQHYFFNTYRDGLRDNHTLISA